MKSLFYFFFLIKYCSSDISVSIDHQNGNYSIFIHDRLWFRSSYTGLYSNNRWFKSNDQSLRLIEILSLEGNDFKLGEWNQTEFIYQLNDQNQLKYIKTIIRQWKSLSAITFYFNNMDFNIENDLLLDMDQVLTVFPSFFIEKFDKDDERGYFTSGGMMMGDEEKHAGLWNSRTEFVKGGMTGGPLIIFNLTDHGEKDSIIFSPLTEFLTTSISINKQILEYGFMGSLDFIPINSTNSFLLFYSSNGINQLIQQWGETMQFIYSKTNENRLNDLTINYLGYYTDNGGYYYYNTFNNLNYEETIVQLKEKICLPIHYIQLDSWWYYKGLGSGVKEWNSRPQIFPNGLKGLSEKLKSFPLALHNRYWSSDTIYSTNYSFIIDKSNLKSLPCGNDSFWIDLFNSSSKEWNLVLYEQDWMNHQTIDFLPLKTKFSLGKSWLKSMDFAANLFNINIQFCMSLPRHALQTLQMTRVTQARVSDDYFIHIVHQIKQWDIGITSLFVDALGIAPFKDIFWSNQIEPNAPYQHSAKEILPDREILIATLSTGPVAFADGIDYIDQQRILKSCRLDGLILKPDRPLTMINLLISDWSEFHGIQQGQLYSTKTILNNQIFSIIFASAMKRTYSIVPSMIGGTSAGLIWSYENPFQLFYFNQNNSLEIRKELCNERSFCLWYNSPLLYFNDSLRTKYSFMGELNKWTFVSRQRFSSLHLNKQNTQMIITIQGTPNESVYLLVYHSKFQSIIRVVCQFYSEKLQTRLIINSTDVICL